MSMLAGARMESAKCCYRLRGLAKSKTFIWALLAATFSGVLGVVLRVMDKDLGHDFLKDYNPDIMVFNVFLIFTSLVTAFRTSHALVRYTDAAAMMHKLAACWYDATSTLVAYCRGSPADEVEIRHFQETLLRLISLLNALCLDGLEQKESDFESGHCFEVIGWKDLNDQVQDGVMTAKSKVEFAFQCIQQLVVDAINSKVLSIAPPLLTRSIQELGAGMLIYHEAKKLSCVPLPFAYQFITRVILCCEAVFMPFMLAVHTQGVFSTFWYSFGGTVLLWFLNGVAESLDNPFRKEASTLNTGDVQFKLNVQLREVVRNADCPTPALRVEWLERKGGRMSAAPQTMESVKKTISGKSLTLNSLNSGADLGRLNAGRTATFNEEEDEVKPRRRGPRQSVDSIETSFPLSNSMTLGKADADDGQRAGPARSRSRSGSPSGGLRSGTLQSQGSNDYCDPPAAAAGAPARSRGGWGLGLFSWRGSAATEEKARGAAPLALSESEEDPRQARGNLAEQKQNMGTPRSVVMV